jgi:predicted outer membrane lipoprotein
MGTFIKFTALAAILGFALLFAVVAGDDGPWYFAWLVGTVMIILISAAGAVLLETQSQSGDAGDHF